MECPKCGAPLAREEEAPGRPFVCGGCRGLWLTLEGLETVRSGLRLAREDDDEAPGELVEYLRMHGRKIRSGRRCPACGGVMARKAYPALAHTALDFCWPCGAVWFDKGELAKVSGLDPADPAEAPQPRRGKLRVVRSLETELRDWRRIGPAGHRGRDAVRDITHFLSSYHRAKARARRRRKGRKSTKKDRGRGKGPAA